MKNIAKNISNKTQKTPPNIQEIKSNKISYIALIFSFFSLLISALTYYGDRPVIIARSVAVTDTMGVTNLNVSVSNEGKRAISINHVYIVPKQGGPGLFINFAQKSEDRRIDIGDCKSIQISPKLPANSPVNWSSFQELSSYDIYVEDATGIRHRAYFPNEQYNTHWLNIFIKNKNNPTITPCQ